MSMESRIAQRWAGTEKTSRLLKRHIKILEKHLDSRNLDGWEQIDYDSLPPQVRRDLDRVKAGESLWSDVNRWIDDYMNDKRYRRASEKTALVKTKNKRIFLDLRGGTLILDFRGDTGMRSLDPKKLQNIYRDFFIDVVNTEKNVDLPSTSKGHSSIEVYKNELGFHVQRWYKWDGIAEQLGWDFDASGEEYSTGDLVRALADALSGAGWKVTPA